MEPIFRRVQRGKSVRYEEIIIPAGSNDVGSVNDDQKTMMLHIALAAFDIVLSTEKPKSARYCKINTAIDRVLEQIDIYRIEGWAPAKASRASAMVDIFNVMIAQEFGAKL